MPIYNGNEWMRAEDTPARPVQLTRADKQAILNMAYVRGNISVEEWREKTDELSPKLPEAWKE